MKKHSQLWYVLLGLFYAGLAVYVYQFFSNVAEIEQLHLNSDVQTTFEGNDWVVWKDTPDGVVADAIHPILNYKSFGVYKSTGINSIQAGDRLLKIGGLEIQKAETVDQIMKSTQPGDVEQFFIKSGNPGALQTDSESRMVLNGFRMGYTFNSNGVFWQISLWLAGIGTFMSLIALIILVPIIRGNIRNNRAMLGLIVGALLFFGIQLIHHLYLIVESDLDSVYIEKIFLILYFAVLVTYAVNYFHIKAEARLAWYAIPSFIVGAVILAKMVDIIYFKESLRFYHDLIEHTTYLFFYIHILSAILLYMVRKRNSQEGLEIRHLLSLIGIGAIALVAIWYYSFAYNSVPMEGEVDLAIYHLLVFFPLVNSSFLQLQFGKVRFVITRSIQYLLLILFSIALFILINQLYESWMENNPYQRILSFITFLITILGLRYLYLAYENRFARYFISSQEEKVKKLRSFIAQIPQYTSSRMLRKDMVDQLIEYFNTDNIFLWWRGDNLEGNGQVEPNNQYEQIYRELTAGSPKIWSKNKEIAPFRLNRMLEDLIYKSTFSLICPITVTEEDYALLMLGKKKRGVYNLSDLELISQLIQQTQLTLNVLQLVTREKMLIQQKYEADLMALRSQINPHFLFNTLNSLTELVHESPERAEDAIEKLSYIFRYTTKESSKNLVPLKNEIQLISTYLELEKIRFGNRLNFSIKVSPQANDVEIPAFVLQTLVENCIKHGVSKILHDGVVEIDAFVQEGFLVVEVRDNGPGIDLNRIYKSTGLSNTIKRFENIYTTKNLLHFENTGNGTLVRFKVPLGELQKL